MQKEIKRVVVTGGAGQVAYSLIFRIAAGELFGPKQRVALHIRDLPVMKAQLEGVAMELEDCAFPLLAEVKIGSDPSELFADVDCAFLVGAKPRGPGMERKDLLVENGKIFVTEGRALNEAANTDVRVLVVGNPCNTNCLIALRAAPRLSPHNFHAMLRLDENRAKGLLAKRAQCSISSIRSMVVLGNHSATQVPDYMHAEIRGKSAVEVIADLPWLQGEFITKLQNRGAEIIAARGKSSAASAANAALDAMKALFTPTMQGDTFSSGILSDGNSYGIAPGLIFGFPLRSAGDGAWEMVHGLTWDSFLQEKLKVTEKELLAERDLIAHLIGK